MIIFTMGFVRIFVLISTLYIRYYFIAYKLWEDAAENLIVPILKFNSRHIHVENYRKAPRASYRRLF